MKVSCLGVIYIELHESSNGSGFLVCGKKSFPCGQIDSSIITGGYMDIYMDVHVHTSYGYPCLSLTKQLEYSY